MKKPKFLKSTLLGVIALASAITLPSAHAETITWNGWTFDYEVGVNSEGLALKNVKYQGHTLLKKISLPVIQTTGPTCYVEAKLGSETPFTPIGWANNAIVAQRQFSLNGKQWYEIGVLQTLLPNTPSSLRYYQAYYLSSDGLLDAHLFSRGAQGCDNSTIFSTAHFGAWILILMPMGLQMIDLKAMAAVDMFSLVVRILKWMLIPLPH